MGFTSCSIGGSGASTDGSITSRQYWEHVKNMHNVFFDKYNTLISHEACKVLDDVSMQIQDPESQVFRSRSCTDPSDCVGLDSRFDVQCGTSSQSTCAGPHIYIYIHIYTSYTSMYSILHECICILAAVRIICW